MDSHVLVVSRWLIVTLIAITLLFTTAGTARAAALGT
jgi:hypothetical protein